MQTEVNDERRSKLEYRGALNDECKAHGELLRRVALLRERIECYNEPALVDILDTPLPTMRVCDSDDYNAKYSELCIILGKVRREHLRATDLHPYPNPNLRQLVEEVGEVAKSLRNIENGTETLADLVNECVQVAAMALRVAIEGES